MKKMRITINKQILIKIQIKINTLIQSFLKLQKTKN